jgi:hypothetical protein
MACLSVSGDERSGCCRETPCVVGVLRGLPSDDDAIITEQGQHGGVNGLGGGTMTGNLQRLQLECLLRGKYWVFKLRRITSHAQHIAATTNSRSHCHLANWCVALGKNHVRVSLG